MERRDLRYRIATVRGITTNSQDRTLVRKERLWHRGDVLCESNVLAHGVDSTHVPHLDVRSSFLGKTRPLSEGLPRSSLEQKALNTSWSIWHHTGHKTTDNRVWIGRFMDILETIQWCTPEERRAPPDRGQPVDTRCAAIVDVWFAAMVWVVPVVECWAERAQSAENPKTHRPEMPYSAFV